ncbi:hypothetical protein [Telmatospirillum sp.]|uniref:hypothetical protein n=1 Tax=Telmatospirillum sp. TaxID=2079197 RepID=UPI00285136BD|nr:hypothetical protein [Telmatospirillum sp.]MDR3435927.1 hypothetical protein [Telmatospirillum sp.]
MQQISPFHLVLGELRLPFDEAVGGTALAQQDFKFRFSYHHISFAAECRHKPDQVIIALTGDVGPMPFSAESAVARAELQTVLNAANAHLGDIFRVVEGRILMVGEVSLVRPLTAVGLIAGMARFLLSGRPYLETIDVFLSPLDETETTGEVALRPGWRRASSKSQSAARQI